MRPSMRALADGGPYDVAVVGAGIHGVWTARHAATNGLRTLLVDKEDYGAGTTSRSTMLAHGGLRYLAQRDLGLVREALVERGVLTRMAPHLVRPIPFLLPFYRGAPYRPWQLRIGLWIYTWLARGSGYPRHRILSRDEVLAREPTIRPQGLVGGALYFDGQILSPERLAFEIALDARSRGAFVRNHTSVDGLLDGAGGRVEGLRLRDTVTGETADIGARCVVNATGPWLDRFLKGTRAGDSRLRLTKGVHLLTPVFSRHAIIINAPDGRTFFTIPWHDHELVGTTDTDYTADPDDVHAEPADVSYLVRATREFFPDAPLERVVATNAGLRNLMRVEGKAPSDVTRRALILDHADEGVPGLVSVLGGKLTTARRTGLEVLDDVCRVLGRRPSRHPKTEEPLPGGNLDVGAEEAAAARWASDAGLPGAVGLHLVRLMGARWPLAASLPAKRVCEHGPTLVGALEAAVGAEDARTPLDAIRRRTLAWATPCRGRDAVDASLGHVAAAYRDDEATLRRLRDEAVRDIELHSLWARP